jgi:hypothetical protein
MDLTFNIDFDAAEVHIIVDNHLTLVVTEGDHNSYIYKNFDKLDDDVVQSKIKSVARILLTLEQDND